MSDSADDLLDMDETPCLAARLDGPDHQPFLCCLRKGHQGQHQCRRSNGELVWRWGRMDRGSFGVVERPDGSLHWERLDWMCQCEPPENCTPERNLSLLVAWAKGNPGQVPTCAKCGKPFDLRNALEAVGPEVGGKQKG